MKDFAGFGIDTQGRTGGRIKTHCPQCRDGRSDKRDKSLSVDLDKGVFNCHYCGWKGCVIPNAVRNKPAGYSFSYAEESREGAAEAVREWTGVMAKRGIPTGMFTAMGITFGLEYMPQTGKKELCICFNYLENGKRVNTKYRDLNKHFKLIAGAEMIPYNIDRIHGERQCIITEGEIDALSFAAIGRPDVVSVPGGANNNLAWMDRFVETHFEDKEVIYLAVDADRKGQELLQELQRRLGVERCRTVTYPPDCKDANDTLVKYGEEVLRRALEEAPETPLEGVYSADDAREELRVLFENGMERGAETGLEDLDKYCTFELGRLCVITGVPGCGKSEFVDELVVRLGLKHGWKTAFFSPENMPLSYHLRKLMEKLSGRRFKKGFMPEPLYEACVEYLDKNVCSIFPKDNFTADNILGKARELVRRRGIRVLVIDPFNRLEHQVPAGQTETQHISAFLDSLTNFAQRNNCLVILVAHPRKMNREPGSRKDPVPGMYDINGSAAFVNKCDFGLVVERDREAGVTRVHIKKVKFRHLGNVGEASFVYNTVNGRYTPCIEDADAHREEDRVRDVRFDSGSWLREEDICSEGASLFDNLGQT